jgi:hypothetical protein
MIFDVPQGIVSVAAVGVCSAASYGIKLITSEVLAYIREGRADQKEVLKLTRDLVAQLGLSRELSGIKRAVLRMNSQAFTCEACGGWDGPEDEKPKGLKVCACSERPPPLSSQPKA